MPQAISAKAVPSSGVRARSFLAIPLEEQDHFSPTRSTSRLPSGDVLLVSKSGRKHRTRASSDLTLSRNLQAFRNNEPSTHYAQAHPFSRALQFRVPQNSKTSGVELSSQTDPQIPFTNPFNNPKELLLRRNPFSSTGNGSDVEDSSETSSDSRRSSHEDSVVASDVFRLEATGDRFNELEEDSDLGTQAIPRTDEKFTPDFTFAAADYPTISEPKDPARILKRSDLRKQRSFFFSIVICMNLAALFGAIFAGGTWVFVFILFIKSKDCLSVFISAVGLLCSSAWRLMIKPKPVSSKWILTLIPAYSESEEQIVKTIFSLRDNNVEPHKQVMCVILDGKHRSVREHMTRMIMSMKRPYITSKFKRGELIIDAGFMEDVPVICFEKVKNSGKKDSLILCHDLFNAMRENAPLYTRLLRTEIWTQLLPILTQGTDFTRFDMVFCTDADSTIYKGAVAALANAIARNKNAIAACGLVLVELEPGYKWSRWNLYQQFQYTFGQYVRRRAEGMFGKVTCLPGCITMIAVRPEMAGAIRKYAEPITAYPVILHQVQYLGTDRRLTYSMLSQHQKLQTLFVPEAVSETVAPQSLQHYLSQRRRWGSNAYFNNFFYCFGENMIPLTRLAASVELVRLTMVYYRIANTIMFVIGLTKEVKIMKIVPLLVISQLPTLWFMFCVFFVERELQRRAGKLLLGFCINKVISPFLAVTVFTKVVKNLGSQVWGLTGGANATAADAPSASAPALSMPGASATAVALGERRSTVVMETFVEGGLGEQLANLPDDELDEEERNEKLAGTEEPMAPF